MAVNSYREDEYMQNTDKKKILTRLFSYLLEQIGEDGQVIDTSYTARVSEGQLHVTLTAECREEIGVEIPSTREIPGETPAE